MLPTVQYAPLYMITVFESFHGKEAVNEKIQWPQQRLVSGLKYFVTKSLGAKKEDSFAVPT